MSETSNFFPSHARRCRGPISRRSFLEAGALSLLGLGMSDVLRAETIARAAGGKLREKSVIFIWLPGGMSHLESYDMKPDAPLEYRGALRPIKTNVPGVEICELFPRQAKRATGRGVDGGRQGIDTFSFGAAYLGASTTPFVVAGDPSAPDFKVQNIGLTPDMQTRLDDRVHLLDGMDRLRR